MIVGERMLLPCVGGPTAWRAVAFPPPFEVETDDGIYVLVDDGEPMRGATSSSAPAGLVTTDVVPVLRVGNASETLAWYARLGFELSSNTASNRTYPPMSASGARAPRSTCRSMPATPILTGSSMSGSTTSTPIAAEFGVAVDEQPWAREVDLTDPDGNRLRVAVPAAPISMPTPSAS